MGNRAILFETTSAAQKVYQTLQPMIEVSLDCNAVLYDRADEELVRWLSEDDYCYEGAARKIYLYTKQKSVLLVGNDFNLLLLLREYLDFVGLQAACAESGAKAWQFYYRNSPNIIISGIDMEKIDAGYSLLRRIKQSNPHQPFIFLSSQMNLFANRARALELGADECFGKPFELEELLVAIDRLLLDNRHRDRQ